MGIIYKATNIVKGINSKNWEITFPDGKSIIINNLFNFCKQNNLDYSKAAAAAKRKRIYKNYFFKKMDK